MNRKHALKRLNGLAPRVEEHLDKIRDNPSSQDIAHWTREVERWIRHMAATKENLMPVLVEAARVRLHGRRDHERAGGLVRALRWAGAVVNWGGFNYDEERE